jgi:hypothetical protein
MEMVRTVEGLASADRLFHIEWINRNYAQRR